MEVLPDRQSELELLVLRFSRIFLFERPGRFVSRGAFAFIVIGRQRQGTLTF